VTEGVHAAHRAGLIHRDIKPTNILVERGEDGRWKPYVMDFGLARDWQREATVTGTVLGTPHYMAPEQARGEVSQLDRRADVYSLGATLYVMLTGKTPIPGTHILEVLTNLATMEARPLREHDRNVPAELEAIVLKCLEREPSARYDSARALAEDLERFLHGEPVQARAVGAWYQLRKRARKYWALLRVSIASAVLVLMSAALWQAELTQRHANLHEQQAPPFAARAGDVDSYARIVAQSRRPETLAERQDLRATLKPSPKQTSWRPSKQTWPRAHRKCTAG
jgi:serine/threonine protein kinase